MSKGEIMRRLHVLAAVVMICGILPGVAKASETVSLAATFTPNRPGADATVVFSVKIGTTTGQVPSPITHMNVKYPAGLSFVSSTLGLATCSQAALEEFGLEGCSPNAQIGVGAATVELPLGPSEVFSESARTIALLGSSSPGRLGVLFLAIGDSPVRAEFVFPTEIQSGSESPGPYGIQLDAPVSPIPGIPGGPNISVVSFSSGIGPMDLTYYKRSHGKTVAFHPKGITIPKICPRQGFPFAASFSFEDGTEVAASATVHCASPSHRR
jgi:hypothetical protein